MPQAVTTQFGTLRYQEQAVLTFPAGLPGFESCRRFVLLEQPGLAPVVHLQSLEQADLCFLAMPVQVIDADYRLMLFPEDVDVLQLADHAPPLLLALLSVSPADGSVTANLMAPIVVNLATRVALQAVRADRQYSHECALAEPAACS